MRANPQWFLLLKLAELGASRSPIFTSSPTLSRSLECSQQTVSRWLKDLSMEGLIKRQIQPRGEDVEITPKGLEELHRIYSILGRALEGGEFKPLRLEGEVFTGLGEGAYYVTREGYMKQFVEQLGFTPYPGTLNLKLTDPHSLTARKELEGYPAISIEPFSNGQRSFGGASCIPALINDRVKGVILRIQRTHYDPSVIEIISPLNLREALNIEDGSRVSLEIIPPNRTPPKAG